MQFQKLSIIENHPLKNLTTFRIGGNARYFAEVESELALRAALQYAGEKDLPILVLGGGSNVLISDEGFDGFVVSMNIKGFEIIEESPSSPVETSKIEESLGLPSEVIVKIASGEVWDEVVARCVDEGWWGVENLSYIPGKMGAFAIQNVGAYGQEASQVIEKIEVMDIETSEIRVFSNADCRFSYRSSIFNGSEKGKYIILNTILRLRIDGKPNMTYPDVVSYFDEKGIKEPTLAHMREAVIDIRKRKLPDVEVRGSSGSFIKNLLLSEEEYELLVKNIEQNFSLKEVEVIRSYYQKFRTFEGIKIPTGYLIEICGLKGLQVGGAKVHERAGLVIVNETGEASAKDVLDLFAKVQKIVKEKTEMEIEAETQILT